MRLTPGRSFIQLIYVLMVTLLLLPFQNCSRMTTSGTNSSYGGPGTDGKVYKNYGVCPNNIVDVKNVIQMSKAHANAMFVRANCQDLPIPQPVNAEDLKFAANDPSVLLVNGQVYDEQQNVSAQRVSLEVCTSAGPSPSVQTLIWQHVGNANATYGNITQSDGQETGTLAVQYANNVFSTITGQSSTFDLTLGQSSGVINYKIGNGPQISSLSLNCVAQSPPNVTDDGSSAAPSGPAQHPFLLNNYAARAPWKVAGVDYAVGFPSGLALKDPTQDPAVTGNPNITVNSTDKEIVINGNNVTLDGYDFDLAGYTVGFKSGTNATIRNSRIKFVRSYPGSSGLTVTNCIMDGTNGAWAVIYHEGAGLLTAKYNWMKNTTHAVQMAGPSGQLQLKYNLIENFVANYVEESGGTYSSLVVEFNTTYQAVNASPDEGFRFYGGGTMAVSLAYNSMIAAGSPGNYSMSFPIHVGGGSPPLANITASIHDNFMDTSGALGSFYTGVNHDGHCDATYSSNTNMVNGQALPTDP